MNTRIYTSLALAGLITLAGCGGGDTAFSEPAAPAQPAPPAPPPPTQPPAPPAPPVPTAVTVTVDFNAGIEGWVGGVSDYYDSSVPGNVVFEQRTLAAPLSGKAFYISSHNNSDDVLTYVKKQVGGLVPNAKYTVDVELHFASHTAAGCPGVGGGEGDSLYMVTAVSAIEPLAVKRENGEYRMNIDRGNQAMEGPAGRVLGLVGNPDLKCDNSVFGASVRKSASPITVQADAAGKVWLMLGTDSAYESTGEAYLQGAIFSAKPVP